MHKISTPRQQKFLWRILLTSLLLLRVTVTIHAQLIGEWHLDNTANDGSGNGYNGTPQGAPSYGTANKEGSHALSLNGSAQYIDLGNPALFPSGTSARSISAWAMTNNVTNGYQWIFAYGTDIPSQAMFIGAGHKTLIGGSYANDIAYDGENNAGFWEIGVWHHICLTFDGTTAKLYADGVFVKSLTPSPTWDLHAAKAYIGRQVNNNEYWNGLIDDVRIYNKALSDAEVHDIAAAPPAVPTALNATVSATSPSNTIDLTWHNEASNATGVQIERSDNDSIHFNLKTTVSDSKSSYSDTTVASGTTYYYRIRAINTGGVRTYSSTTHATTAGAELPVPAGLSASITSLTTINLSWQGNSTGATSYQIESRSSTSVYTPLMTVNGNTLTATIPSLPENTMYYFRIRAVNASGRSQYSSAISIATSAVPPSAPTSLSVAVIYGATANLTWTDNSSNETNFEIERSPAGGTYVLIATVGRDIATYADAATTWGERYSYRVRAVNNGGASVYTNSKNARIGISELIGEWQLNSNLNDASGNNRTGIAAIAPVYSDSCKEGSKSLIFNGTTQYVSLDPSILPFGAAPKTLCAWAKTDATDNSIRSAVTIGINQISHALYIGQQGTALVTGGFGDDFTVANVWSNTNQWHHVCLTYDGSTASVYVDGELKTSGQKNWSLIQSQAYAYIGRLFSDFENLWRGEIDDVRIYEKALTAAEVGELVLKAPAALTTSTTNPGKVNLTWTDRSTNETNFQIERSISANGPFNLIACAASDKTSFTDATVADGTTYYYRVKAVNASTGSSYTNVSSTAVSSTPPVNQGQVWDAIELQALKDLKSSWNFTGSFNWDALSAMPANATNDMFGTLYGVIVSDGDIVSLELGHAGLEGPISPSIGNLTALTSLDLSANNFSCALPSTIGNLSNLNSLVLQGCNLTGIPDEILKLHELSYLILCYNSITALPNFNALPNAPDNIYIEVYANPLDLFSMEINILNGLQGFNFVWQYPSLYYNVRSTALEEGTNVIENDFAKGADTFRWKWSLNNGIDWTYIPASEGGELKDLRLNGVDVTYVGRQYVCEEGTAAGLFNDMVQNSSIFVIESVASIPVPDNLAAIASTSSAAITLTWDSDSSVGTGFEIARSSSANGTFVTIATVVATVDQYDDETVQPATTYYYKIRRLNGIAYSSYTPVVSQTTLSLIDAVIGTYAFQYKYDIHNRTIAKKVPGADWVYMVYDERDRLVMSQDGNQRKNNQWSYTEYDVLNRPIIAGIYTHPSPLEQADMSVLVNGNTVFYESYNGDVNNHGYTKNIFGSSFNGTFEPAIITYYNNYDFRGLWGSGYKYVSDGLVAGATGVTYEQVPTGSENELVSGYVTGTEVKVLGAGTWLKNINYYDDKYRIIQTIGDNILGGCDVVSNVVDFAGKVIQTKTTHANSAIRWKDIQSMEVAVNSMQSLTSGSGASATSVATLPADVNGWIEFSVSLTADDSVFEKIGFRSVGSSGDPEYSFSFSQFSVAIQEKGVEKWKYEGIRSGDRFKIERTNGNINYIINGFGVYSSPLHGEALEMVVKAGGSAQISRISSSFNQEGITTTLRSLYYDHAGRLLTIWHRVNDSSPILLVSNEYNELGQLVTKKLYNTDSPQINFKQNVDYRYNIRGWLTRINDSDLTDIDGGPKDYFGLELGYNNAIGATAFTPQYNGNISAAKWSSNLGMGLSALNEPTARAYAFSYDPMNRLLRADHATKINSWQTSMTNQETVGYDLNGSIQNVYRSGTTGNPADMLSYTYGNSNHLRSVSDAGMPTAGFHDGNTSGDDFQYDANGNLTQDKNKAIHAIKYDTFLNQIEEIDNENGNVVKSTYSADGIKLSEEVYTGGSTTPQTKTQYVGPFVYVNDTLSFIQHEEGKVILHKEQPSTPEYQYQLKDHLGNVRVTFTTKQDSTILRATMEDTGVGDSSNPRVQEMGYFGNLFETEIRNVNQWLNHTRNAPGNAVYLDGSDAKTVGPYTLLKVYPGDTVRMKAYGKFERESSYSSTSITALIAALITPIQTAGQGLDGIATPTRETLTNGLGSLFTAKSSNTNVPNIFLNYILFDKNLAVVDAGYSRIDEGAGFESGEESTVAFGELTLKRIIDRTGYIYVYVSNESPGTPVWFDDLTISYCKSPIIQFEDYYPFGLSVAGTAFERGNDNYNGMITTGGTGLKDLGFRQYDPALGRFHAVDPLAELKYNEDVYHYAGNDPFNKTDVLGLMEGAGSQASNFETIMQGHLDDTRDKKPKEKNGYSRYDGPGRTKRISRGNNKGAKRKDVIASASASVSGGGANASGGGSTGGGQKTGVRVLSTDATTSDDYINSNRYQQLKSFMAQYGAPTSLGFAHGTSHTSPGSLSNVVSAQHSVNLPSSLSIMSAAAIESTTQPSYGASFTTAAVQLYNTVNSEAGREYVFSHLPYNEARALYEMKQVTSASASMQPSELSVNVGVVGNTMRNGDVFDNDNNTFNRNNLQRDQRFKALTTEGLRDKARDQCPMCEQWKINIISGNALEYAWERMSKTPRNFTDKFQNGIRSKEVRPDFVYTKREHTTNEKGEAEIFSYDKGLFVEVKVSQNAIDKTTSNAQVWAEINALSKQKDSGLVDIFGDILGQEFGGKKAPDGVLSFILVVTEGTKVDPGLIDEATSLGISFFVSYAYENIQTGGVVFSEPERQNFFGPAVGPGSQLEQNFGVTQSEEGVQLEMDRANFFYQRSNEYDETQP